MSWHRDKTIECGRGLRCWRGMRCGGPCTLDVCAPASEARIDSENRARDAKQRNKEHKPRRTRAELAAGRRKIMRSPERVDEMESRTTNKSGAATTVSPNGWEHSKRNAKIRAFTSTRHSGQPLSGCKRV